MSFGSTSGTKKGDRAEQPHYKSDEVKSLVRKCFRKKKKKKTLFFAMEEAHVDSLKCSPRQESCPLVWGKEEFEIELETLIP